MSAYTVACMHLRPPADVQTVSGVTDNETTLINSKRKGKGKRSVTERELRREGEGREREGGGKRRRVIE